MQFDGTEDNAIEISNRLDSFVTIDTLNEDGIVLEFDYGGNLYKIRQSDYIVRYPNGMYLAVDSEQYRQLFDTYIPKRRRWYTSILEWWGQDF